MNIPISTFLMCLCISQGTLIANTGAAELGAGGLRPKSERRVSMISERLFISRKQIRVDYEFMNTSSKEVVTEVAFPLPETNKGPWIQDYWVKPIAGFTVVVGGRPQRFKTQVEAWVKGRNVTSLLKAAHVDIASFAHLQGGATTGVVTSQIDKLSKANLRRLRQVGAIELEVDNEVPTWTVRTTYHWVQRFPAGKTIHVAHSYVPVPGGTPCSLASVEAPSAELNTYNAPNRTLEPSCADQRIRDLVSQRLDARSPQTKDKEGKGFNATWVRYILTTANTWQTPIRDFQLEVLGDAGDVISFCWNGPREILNPSHIKCEAKDFVPKGELTVYFLEP